MSVMVSVEMPIRPEKFDEAVAFLRDILPDTRAFEGANTSTRISTVRARVRC